MARRVADRRKPAKRRATRSGHIVTRRKSAPVYQTIESARGGWVPLVREPFAGAWQRNIIGGAEDLLAFAAVFACARLIAQDIAKLRITLVQQMPSGVWDEIESPAFSPVLRKPNRYQNRIEFVEQWQSSKLLHGNTYVLKERDDRQVVRAMYVLEPSRVRVLVAPDGSVFYALGSDNLAGLDQANVVPASEIIHDRYWAAYHPLCGITPLTACWLAASQGLRLQNQSEAFFANGAVPSGIITTPQDIEDDQARQIQQRWHEQFSGNNVGRVAVLGLDMKYEPMTMKATDAQLIEQLKWTGENVCTAFGVPPYMVGIGPPPNYNNIEALNQQYYTQTLQSPIEKLELCLDEGLGLAPDKIDGVRYGTELELDDLLRMDTATRVDAASKAVLSGLSFNEVRKRYHGVGPVEGGDEPFIQEQNWPVRLLAQRQLPPERPPTPPADPDPPQEDDDAERQLTVMVRKHLGLEAAA